MLKLSIEGQVSTDKELVFSLKKDGENVRLMVNMRGGRPSEMEHILTILPSGEIKASYGVSAKWGLNVVGGGETYGKLNVI